MLSVRWIRPTFSTVKRAKNHHRAMMFVRSQEIDSVIKRENRRPKQTVECVRVSPRCARVLGSIELRDRGAVLSTAWPEFVMFGEIDAITHNCNPGRTNVFARALWIVCNYNAW